MTPLLAPYIQTARLDKVRPYLNGRILDLGCGMGHLIPLLAADQAYLGVDHDAVLVQRVQARYPDRRFAVCDLDREDLQLEQSFDTVVLSAVLEHLADPTRLLGSIKRHLESGGTVVLTTPTPLGHWVHSWGARLGLFHMEAALDHKCIYDRARLFQLFSRHGFTGRAYQTFLLGCNQVFAAARD